MDDKKRRWVCMALCVVLLCAELVVWLSSPDRWIATLKEDAVTVSMLDRLTEAEGYLVDGQTFTPESADPRLWFATEGCRIATILVSFDAPLTENAPVEVYYAVAGQDLSEEFSVHLQAPAGRDTVVVPIPDGVYETIRIDVNAAFTLRDISFSETGANHSLSVSAPAVKRLIILFAVTVLVTFALYMATEKQAPHPDPLTDKVRSFFRTVLPTEPLTAREKVYLLICFSAYLVLSLVFIHWQYGPDEAMRYDVPKYIFENNALPKGWEEEIRHPQWGISYGFSITMPYLLSAFFMKIASLFGATGAMLVAAARLTSVFSMTGVCYYALLIAKRLRLGATRHIFVWLLTITPQTLFLSSYFNLDAFGLFCMIWLFYLWLRGSEEAWSRRSCVWLGTALGFCLLSYPFAYPFALCSALYYCLWHLTHRKTITFKRFFVRGLLIVGVAFVLAGWYFIRNGILYHGDIFALNASRPYGDLYAVPELKPSLRQTWQSRGFTLFGMLRYSDWIQSTWRSLFYGLGYMSLFGSVRVYRFFTMLVLVGGVGTGLSFFFRRDRRRFLWMPAVLVALAAVVGVGISLYYSWSSDYQPQGRYILASLPFLAWLSAWGTDRIIGHLFRENNFLKKSVTALVGLGFIVIDFSAFIQCLTAFVYSF